MVAHWCCHHYRCLHSCCCWCSPSSSSCRHFWRSPMDRSCRVPQEARQALRMALRGLPNHRQRTLDGKLWLDSVGQVVTLHRRATTIIHRTVAPTRTSNRDSPTTNSRDSTTDSVHETTPSPLMVARTMAYRIKTMAVPAAGAAAACWTLDQRWQMAQRDNA